MAPSSQTRSGENADSPNNNRPTTTAAYASVVLVFLTTIGLVLRALRISWQPLWWDEGYSVYFATESLARLLSLTANDIHPPLYYLLLHGWLRLVGDTGPASLRTFSVVAGVLAIPAMVWLARGFFPEKIRPTLVATSLLVLSPIHLYYSQEIRMYGLALLLGMVSTACLWRLVQRPTAGRYVGYTLSATLGLYALYYFGFLLLAHGLWALWAVQRSSRRLAGMLMSFGVVILLYLPWLFYAIPKLLIYVDDKVASDKDVPLTIVRYIARHATAFISGHVAPSDPRYQVFIWPGLIALLLLIAGMLIAARKQRDRAPSQPIHSATSSPLIALSTFVLLPLVCGFLLNLWLPFFPEGGERVMLYVLPYLLLLIAAAIEQSWSIYHLGKVALAGLLVSAVAGIGIYYTTPRYVERDYRPLIEQIVEQGQDGDSYLAIFPWQLGYWRAYTPWNNPSQVSGPTPLLLSDSSVTWDEQVAADLDAALAGGTVWFPAPLSFGSTLPATIEEHLSAQASNVENRWHGAATRLSAWRQLMEPEHVPYAADFGPIILAGGSVIADDGSDNVESANEIVVVALAWEPDQGHPQSGETAGEITQDDLAVTLRLRDMAGQVWASRDYAPLGAFATPDDSTLRERVGLIVPVGLAPDRYRISVGVGISGTESLLYPSGVTAETDPLVDIGEVDVLPPVQTQPVGRLPIQTPLAPPQEIDGIAFLGQSGIESDRRYLAGTELKLTLFLQNRHAEPPIRQLYLSLLNDGQGVGGWEGWPLPGYPMESWPEDALVQAPIALYIPATLEVGPYELIAGLLDPASGEKSAPVSLGPVSVKQRTIQLEPPSAQHTLALVPQLGTHTKLAGYDLSQDEESIYLTLHWQILQTLLPVHHIFVHLDDNQGITLSQQDGPPTTINGRAPSGSWLPGEYISTFHTIPTPSELTIDPGEIILNVGLYNPDGNIRLPVTIDGVSNSDAIALPLSR